MNFLFICLLIDYALPVRIYNKDSFITHNSIFNKSFYSNLTNKDLTNRDLTSRDLTSRDLQTSGDRPIIALLNFKCYLNNNDFLKIARQIDELVLSPNVKLLISPPNIHFHKFRNSSVNSEKYELCSQNVSVFRGFGAFTGEVTAEMLKDIGVNYCLIGHPESDLMLERHGRDEFAENAAKLVNAMENGITPILILNRSDASNGTGQNNRTGREIGFKGDDGFDVDREVKMLIEKLETYCNMLRRHGHIMGKLHINVAYESWQSIGSGIPINPEIIKEIVAGLKHWSVNQQDISICVLYGGSLNANIAKDYIRVGCDGLLFGKCSVTSNLQNLIDNIR